MKLQRQEKLLRLVRQNDSASTWCARAINRAVLSYLFTVFWSQDQITEDAIKYTLCCHLLKMVWRVNKMLKTLEIMGTWVFVNRIEILWFYFLYGEKIRKSSKREKIKQWERYLMFQKTRVFVLLKQIPVDKTFSLLAVTAGRFICGW